MKHTRRIGKNRLSAVLLSLALVAVVVASADQLSAANDGSAAPDWSAPNAMALKRASDIDNTQHQPNFLSNLDCDLLTYRLAATSSMQTGCFGQTAFGLFDSDSGMTIFNGTDEGLPLLGYTSQQVLAPWPGALDLVALQPLSTGGTYVSLYSNPLAALSDQHNALGQLTAKQLTAPPNLPIRDSSGQQLVINPQTLAFSDGGSWIVAEDLNGSFVRINLATLDITAFAPADTVQGNPSLLQSQVAISRDGRYVAINNAVAGSFKIYDLDSCSADGAIDWQPRNCDAYDYQPFVEQQISELQTIRHVRFINDGLISFEAQSSSASLSGIYELAPTASITSLIDYLGLGDSYTSGEGAFDYLAGTDTANDMCHLSSDSYPLLLTHDLFSDLGGHSVACSGAEINDVGSTSDDYRGQVAGVADWQQLEQTEPDLLNSVMTSYMPGYVAQQRFVSQYQPSTLTVSVGGDDVGFGDILERCVEPQLSQHLSDDTCFDTYEDRLEVKSLIDRTELRWTALYKQLQAESPSTRLYVIGYPQIMVDDGNCALNVHLNQGEQEFAVELTNYLNSDIQQAAAAAKVTYVDISQALAGHRLCETASYDVAVNGLTAGTDGGVLGVNIFGKESYHPNALGQALIEQAILKQTHNLTEGIMDSAVPSAGTALLSAPVSGRTVNTLVPDDGLASPVAERGMSVTIAANGQRDGLSALTVYGVSLDGPSGEIIGSATSDQNGNLSAVFTIPPGAVSGGHTIDITGINQAGQPVDITQPIYIPANSNDSDGDGIPDTHDSCPGAPNSGMDSDQDGIDDACDPLIGLSPTNSNGDSSQILIPPTLSNAATFTVNSNATSLTSTTPISLSSVAQMLGARTANPTSLKWQEDQLKVSGGPTSHVKQTWPLLHIIDWLPWLPLVLAIWLVVTALTYYWQQFIEPQDYFWRA